MATRNRLVIIGVSSSGKTQHFDCCIRWFESSYPSQKKHLRQQVLFSTKSANGGRNPPSVDEIASR